MPTYDEALQDPDIVALEEIAPHPNFLVFGGSGSGKTVLGGSDDRVLFLTTEPEGCLSAKRMGSTARQVKIREYDDIENFYEKAYSWSQDQHGIPFTWFVIDGITALQVLLEDKICEEAGKVMPDWPEYRKNQKILLRLVKKINALPVNVLWLSLDRKETDPDGEEFYCPEIHGKGYGIAMQVAACMTSYGYLQVRTDKVPMVRDGEKVINPRTGKQRIALESHRFIFWQDIKSLRGKDRTMALEPFTKDLTLKQIRHRVEAAFAGDADKLDAPSALASAGARDGN